MDEIPWGTILSIVGLVVPIIAFVWEFGVAGRKRLGYRVQMVTSARDLTQSAEADAFAKLKLEDGRGLDDPSFALLRIENAGISSIRPGDYAVPEEHKVGLHVHFPGRRVVGMAITEFSTESLRDSFGPDSGLHTREIVEGTQRRTTGIIDLPKVTLNWRQHYKVLALLEQVDEVDDEQKTPRLIGAITGGAGTGDITLTKSHSTGLSKPMAALIAFLMLVSAGQLVYSLFLEPASAPLDCARGKLALVGSTAFVPVLQEASRLYAASCPGSDFTIDAKGSLEGLITLEQQGRTAGPEGPPALTFSDGEKPDRFPQSLPRPVAFSLFTLVVNKEAGVQDLSLDEIRRLFGGQIANWRDVGGRDMPVRLVNRHSDSGTRRTLEQQVLNGRWVPGDNSTDCREAGAGAPAGVVRCSRASTEDVLDAVAQVPGAVGYSELGIAAERTDVLPVRIDGHAATLEGALHSAYPYWQTEYAYTYGEPKADSLAASFLRYLTNQVGKDVVRAHGHRPCAELGNPVLCRPTASTTP